MTYKCTEEQKEYYRNYYRLNKHKWKGIGAAKEKRRRRHLNRYKMSKGCSVCGYKEHPAALDFHHVNKADKNRGISVMLTYTRRKIFDEIRKCVILCANCHRVEHAKT